MPSQVDDKIKELISEKIKAQINVVMREDEIEELVIHEISEYQREGSGQRQNLIKWISEELQKRVRQMVINEVLDPVYTGTLHGDPGQFYKELIKEHAAEFVSAMFATVLEDAKNAAVHDLTSRIGNMNSNSY